MSIDTIMLVGPSGSGKGTQAALLKEHLKEMYPDRPLLHIETGSRFRNFIQQDGYTNDLMKTILGKGVLAPDFITEWLFVHDLVDEMTEDTILILDGFPRTASQAMTLDSALEFYERDAVYVLNISVDPEIVRERLLDRGRDDDQNIEAVNNRIDWYAKNVLPTIKYLRVQPQYHVFDIDGSVSIEGVQSQIKEALSTNISS
jgi:adenylate kinase